MKAVWVLGIGITYGVGIVLDGNAEAEFGGAEVRDFPFRLETYGFDLP